MRLASGAYFRGLVHRSSKYAFVPILKHQVVELTCRLVPTSAHITAASRSVVIGPVIDGHGLRGAAANRLVTIRAGAPSHCVEIRLTDDEIR